MSNYTAPVDDLNFVINELAGLEGVRKLPGCEDAEPELVGQVLEGAGRLAGEVLAPLNRSGDQNPARIEGDDVIASPGFADAYAQYIADGWNSLPFNPEFGGQGLPNVVSFPVTEIWQSANTAFALCPMLTQAAVEAVEAHGSDDQKHTYLEKLISGEWTGTMDLTEPQAGSDLAAVRCKAVPRGDHYLLQGQKIYITWGDHGMTPNVIHFVLARTPDAPAGVKGISLFLVPKYLLNDDGTPGERNDMRPVSLEHKLGIHASPTCVMSFGDAEGAVGYLVGEENNGLACMFTMMNHARLNVGVQGVAVADRAYQRAVAYARDRVQGVAPGSNERVPIIAHADVRRMLMLMKSQIEAMRAVSVVAAMHMDFAHHATDADEKRRHRARLDLLVPVVKGWCTEQANEVASLGIQVHGGMGFVEDTGAAQHYRDARIAAIYEGTNGIQAQDFVGRKLLRDRGAALDALLEDMTATAVELGSSAGNLADMGRQLEAAIGAMREGSAWLLAHAEDDAQASGSAAFNLMMLAGTVVGGWQMGRAALVARTRLDDNDPAADFLETKIATARFYMAHVLPRAQGYLAAATAGSDVVMGLAEDRF